jgi:putative hydrolase
MRNMGLFYSARWLNARVPLQDFHIHTRYSDGRSDVKDYIRAARRQGYEGICFTDHVDFTTDWYRRYMDEIGEERTRSNGLKVLYGIEVRARDRNGELNAPDDIIEQAEVVIGVVHSIPAVDGKGKHRPEEFGPAELLAIEHSTSMALLENQKVSVLGHPMSNYEKLYGPVPANHYRELLEKAKETGVAVEISAKYKNDFRGFLNLCLEINPLVSLGSDAHSVEEFGRVNEMIMEELK